MDLQAVSIIISLICLLVGAFVFDNIRWGALAALALVIAAAVLEGDLFQEVVLPIGNGLVISAELFLLLFGALLFYEVLSHHGHFHFIEELIQSVPSRVAVVVMLCFFLGSFFEGIAGFGIPAMLIAPLMHRAGYKNLSCIVLSLAANTTCVTFGALGTPLKIGFGIQHPNETVGKLVLLNIFPALLLPCVLTYLYVRTEKQEVDWKKEAGMLLGAGISFVLPYVVMSRWSVEFPSVVAGSVGLVGFITFFVKKNHNLSLSFWWNSFYPYLIFIGLLLLAKQSLVGKQMVLQEELRAVNFFQPGGVFLLAILGYLLVQRFKKNKLHLSAPLRETIVRIKTPLLTIFLLVCYSQVIGTGLATQVSHLLKWIPADLRLFFLPLFGLSGSFVTGSATMSNLLFREMATSVFPGEIPLALALLLTGAAIGSAICLQNIVMVKSVLHSTVQEGKVIRNTLVVALGYLLLVMWVLLVRVVL